MGLNFCDRCGERVLPKGCLNENCERGAMAIPNNVNHMETSILAHFGYTASKGTNQGTRWIAIDRAYHARFGNHSDAINSEYLESLGDARSEKRAERLIDILNGLNFIGKANSDEVFDNRMADISYIKKNYLIRIDES
jgi:hypothetical protein